jgi:phosphoadenosine phosphosulfate reductase
VLPIIDWDNRTVYQYLQKHGLKYHPLWDQGYLSVGDTHTTRKWEPGMAEEETLLRPEARVPARRLISDDRF